MTITWSTRRSSDTLVDWHHAPVASSDACLDIRMWAVRRDLLAIFGSTDCS
jgi:hypothetical protein